MRFIATGLAAAALFGLTACAGNTTRPTDTGNMAFPSPMPAGNVSVTSPTRSLDTGSMALPRSSGGVSERLPTTPDTGNMALPPAAQGNSAPGRIGY